LLERQPLALQAGDAVRDAARLRRARVVEVLAPPAHPVHLLGRVDRLKPERERASKVRGGGGFAACGTTFELGITGAGALAPRYRRPAISFHDFEEFIAALIAYRLADDRAESIHILAQLRVLDRKSYVFAVHDGASYNAQRRAGRPQRGFSSTVVSELS